MKVSLSLLCILALIHCSYAPPVTPDKSKEQDSEIKEDLDEYMEYHRYLKEVVQALESDPDFRERLEKADEDDVRSGKIAEHLDFVNHNVRTKLDELKRRELDRLRHLATKQLELSNKVEGDDAPPSKEHLDHSNPHTFEIEDLKRLIKKTTEDLQAADERRKQEFKEYEMQKEFEKHQKLEGMDEEHRRQYEETLRKEAEARKHHAPVHHPGSKQQLEEVWQKQDHMDQRFDPKAFFMMHDVDGNGAWDADEVKALFVRELDKVYGAAGAGGDRRERAEEMERMREHLFRENDLNRDGLIDFHEFLRETQKADFAEDQGWQTIDENQVYSQNEYEEFQRRRLEEVHYLQQRGLVDGHGRPVPGAEHQIHLALQQYYAHRQQQDHLGAQQQPPLQGQPEHQQVPSAQGQPQYQQAPPPQGKPQYQQAPPAQGQQQYQQAPPSQGQPQYQQAPPPQGQPQYQQAPPAQGQPQNQQAPPPQGQPQNQQAPPPQGQPQYQQAPPPQGQPQYQQAPPAQGQPQNQQVPSQHAPSAQGQPPYQQAPPPQGQQQNQQVPPAKDPNGVQSQNVPQPRVSG